MVNFSKDYVGYIDTYLTEQKLSDITNSLSNSFKNYKDIIKNKTISYSIIDNDIYENDHEWFKKNTTDSLSRAKAFDIKVFIIKNTNKNIKKEFTKFTCIEDRNLRINQRKFNPIDIIKTIDVSFLNEKYNTFIVENHELSRSSFKEIINIIKKSKICSIDINCYDNYIRQQIYFIASLTNTYIIQEDSIFDLEFLLKNKDYLNRLVIKNQREVFREHSICHMRICNYDDFGNYLLNLFQVTYINQPSINCISSTIRKNNINSVLKMLRDQKLVNIEVVIMTHGFKLNVIEIENFQSKYPNLEIKFKYCEDQMKLGDCLNIGIASTKYQYIAKIDDDDIYSSHYLEDNYYSLMYSEVDLVGKGTHFVYLKNLNIVIKREENKSLNYSNIIMGATLFGHRNIMINLK